MGLGAGARSAWQPYRVLVKMTFWAVRFGLAAYPASSHTAWVCFGSLPPGRMLVRAGRQLFSYHLADFGERHLDPLTACRPKMPFQAFVLLTAHHHNGMMPGIAAGGSS